MQKKYQIVDSLDYRGKHMDFYFDDAGQSFFTVAENGQEICFGSYNTDYKEDAKYLIDQELDMICNGFDGKYRGAVLRFFDNAGYSDIQLTYRGRILKVFIVVDRNQVNFDDLINQSVQILEKVLPASC